MLPAATTRLRFREMTPGDLDEMAALLGDPQVMAHYPAPKTRQEAEAWIHWNGRSYAEHGHGLWLVETHDGEFLGDCGLTWQQVNHRARLEVGYHVRSDRQGYGYATEAAAACRDFARDVLGAAELVAILHPDNTASRRVAEKIGMRHVDDDKTGSVAVRTVMGMDLASPATTGRLAILGSGGGSTAARVMDAAGDGTIAADVAVVVGNNSTAGIFDVARTRGVRAVHLSGKTHPDPDELDAAVLGVLEHAGVELVVLAGYMKKLGPRVLGTFAGAILNTHPALLPAYGGQGMYGDRVHAAVLADGRRTTGATVHQVTAGYDEGHLVAQVEVPVHADDDVPTLRARVQEAEKELLVDVIRRWFDDPDEVRPTTEPSRP